MRSIGFTVFGKPQPQGSTKAFIPKGWTKPILTSDNAKLKPWRQDVSSLALEAMSGEQPIIGPVALTVRFYFEKPKSSGKRVTAKTTKPDIDKCLRSILDSLTGIVFKDDAQVVQVECSKEFGTPERAYIEVFDAEAQSERRTA